MRLVVPYVEGMLRPETRDIGMKFGAELTNVGTDAEAYSRLLLDLWQRGNSFGLLEQDLAPSDALLSELLACPHEWCAAPFLYAPEGKRILIWGGLGCTKFSASLLRREPDAMARIAPCHWELLDLELADLLEQRGYEPHSHLPAARHLRLDSPVTIVKGGRDVSHARERRRAVGVQARQRGVPGRPGAGQGQGRRDAHGEKATPSSASRLRLDLVGAHLPPHLSLKRVKRLADLQSSN